MMFPQRRRRVAAAATSGNATSLLHGGSGTTGQSKYSCYGTANLAAAAAAIFFLGAGGFVVFQMEASAGPHHFNHQSTTAMSLLALENTPGDDTKGDDPSAGNRGGGGGNGVKGTPSATASRTSPSSPSSEVQRKQKLKSQPKRKLDGADKFAAGRQQLRNNDGAAAPMLKSSSAAGEETKEERLRMDSVGVGDGRSLVSKDDRVYGHPRMSPIVVEEYKLVFFWIPKVACTVWTLLFHRMAGLDTSKLTFDEIHNPERNPLRYLRDYDLDRADEIMTDPDWTRAVFVRNPHERFLSTYLDKGVGRNFTVVQRDCCPVRRDCAATPEQRTPEAFLELIRGDWKGSKRKPCVNQHWTAQSSRIEDKYWPYVNFVGHFETIQQDARALLEIIGAWEEYGATGWGADGTSPIFEPTSSEGRPHATGAAEQLDRYFRNKPDLFREVTEYYQADYAIPKLGLKPPDINASYGEKSATAEER